MGIDSPSPDHDHLVQFYDTDSELVTEVARAMSIALDQGHAVICVATPAHQAQFDAQLYMRGIDAIAVRDGGQYVALDAAETLARICSNGRPDPRRFTDVVEALIDQLAARFARVWTFGEMVALMCAEGNHAGALELERIWSICAGNKPICLHCAYPSDAFSKEDVKAFVDVCVEHCRLLHSESSLARFAGPARSGRKDVLPRRLPVQSAVDAGPKQRV